MGTLTIILTDGPYISQYAKMAYKIAKAALKTKAHRVKIFLYLDAVPISKAGQNPAFFTNAGEFFRAGPAGGKGRSLPQVRNSTGLCAQRWNKRGLYRGDQDHQPLPPGGNVGGERKSDGADKMKQTKQCTLRKHKVELFKY